MRQGHERRALVVGAGEVRVVRRVVQGVGLAAAGRGERDRFGTRDGGLVEGHRAGPAEHAGRRQGLGIEPDDDARIAGRPGHHEDARSAGPHHVELRERRLDLPDQVAGRDVDQAVLPLAPGHRGDRAVREEPVGRAPEDPGRVGELRLHRGEGLEARAVHQAIEVPPPAAVRDEVEDAVGTPFGLRDRLVGAAGREVRLPERPIGGDRGDAQPGRVPGHVRVVPLEPGDPVAGRCDPWRGDEVRTGHEDVRVTLPVHGDGDDLVARLALAGVVLAHGHEPATGARRRAGPRTAMDPPG